MYKSFTKLFCLLPDGQILPVGYKLVFGELTELLPPLPPLPLPPLLVVVVVLLVLAVLLLLPLK
ncbi:hypothetical protein Hanom_Chr16g01452101 [Helianthus anomalus]